MLALILAGLLGRESVVVATASAVGELLACILLGMIRVARDKGSALDQTITVGSSGQTTISCVE